MEPITSKQRLTDGQTFTVSDALGCALAAWPGLRLLPQPEASDMVQSLGLFYAMHVQVGQRVSFIDPQSGIYTDGVVVCFHGNDQVEVGYHRSGWSDPK